MAHETYAETRRRAFIKTPGMTDLFLELSKFALSALEEPTTTAADNETKHRNDIRAMLRKTYDFIVL